MKKERDLKSHLDGDPSNSSDDSGNMEPDPFEHQEPREKINAANPVKKIAITN
jgi:hypothetical protein